MPIPPHDGGAAVMLQTLNALHHSSCRVDVFLLNTTGEHVGTTADTCALQPYCNRVISSDLDTSVTKFRALRSLLVPKRQVWTPNHRLSYWLERFVDDEATKRLAEMYAKHGPYDVILAESLSSVELAARLKNTLQSSGRQAPPIVYRSHNVENQLQFRMSRERSRNYVERIYRKMLAVHTERNERAVLREVDAVVTMSVDDALVYRSYAPGQQIKTIYPGVKSVSDEEIVASRRQPNTIALLSNLAWPPNVLGVEWFVREVMPRILRERASVVLHIAGRNPSHAVRQLHNGTSVIVHGEVDDANAFRLNYAVNVVAVHSSGGIRIKILDCLALGCPVVSTRIGASGLPSAIEAYIEVADTTDEYAAACVRLLDNQDAATEVAMHGRDFVRREFSWEESSRQLLAFLENVAAAR